MKRTILTSLGMLLVMTVLTGVVYPLLVTTAASFLMPDRAAGSLVYKEGHCAGSFLVGQQFSGQGFFHGRPSASGYGAMPSSASNAGPTSSQLRVAIDDRRESFLRENALSADAIVPVEMLFASGSGLDPHISPAAARSQAGQITLARGIPPPAVDSLIAACTEQRQWGFLGHSRVNVLLLNLALDARCERK